jgi:hypothetical protein
MSLFKYAFSTLLLLFCFTTLKAQTLNPDKSYEFACVGFYNLENLFDTIVDPDTNKILQEDFTPKSSKQWDSKKYFSKLDNMAEVISQIGVSKSVPQGAAVLGVCEIENKLVLDDLVARKALKDKKYQIVHYESPDKRGIDVGFLYQPKYFTVTSSKSFTLKLPDNGDWATRDQLLVTGELNGEKMHFIVCHWPSRRGGQEASSYKRVAAGELAKSIVDSLAKADPLAKVIMMGDLNDDPVDPSVRGAMSSVGEIKKMEDGDMFNPMESLFELGIGTLGYNDAWNLFDQMVLTSSFISLDNSFSTYSYFTAKVFNNSFLKNSSGKFEGFPFRTYSYGKFINGYSDHFPVYLYLVKQK